MHNVAEPERCGCVEKEVLRVVDGVEPRRSAHILSLTVF